MNKNNDMKWAVDPAIHRMTELLEMMEVPEMRRDLNKPSNVRWLLRNVAITNKGPEVRELIALLIKEEARLK